MADMHHASSDMSVPDSSEWLREAVAQDDPEILRDSFATTLRRRRARQRPKAPVLQWVPRWRLQAARPPVLVGGEATGAAACPTLVSQASAGARRRRASRNPWERDAEILHQACREAAVWAEPWRLMVTPGHVSWPDAEFLERLNDVVATTGMALDRLDIAVQEETLARDDPHLVYSLAILRDRGVGIWLTRFGHEVSSLTLLRDCAGSGLLNGVRLDARLLTQAPAYVPADGAVDATAALDRTTTGFFEGVLSAVQALGLSVQLTDVDDEAALRFAMRVGCAEVSGTHCAFPGSGAMAPTPLRADLPPLAG
ncbi:hypothetical protein AA101099_1835 [Neoasaia chiangmaiensis NBRC 101099]|uniref:Uncharacterized protein n=2 Tax=Neoasaia chiangmaiensis TaxID=320497 RepID=A0A1U9KQW7_9PROT|nr:hypothetical protein A0U93_09990 [Neoasaia chiangmaiensis]GBR39827.1 hypothetical protein AA101099_1835 [Neoasaia chiangmaiensis NBRC 101099]GEN14759.1 hypothetical protein NCH01_11900 [Neoasaia chiangmaiensis]